MMIRAAREELNMSIETSEYECPGAQWGVKYNGEWAPGWQGLKRVVKRSRQLCILGAENTFPSPQAYAAQVNWNAKMTLLLSKEPTWRTAKVRRAPEYKIGAWNDTRAIYELLAKEPPSTAVLQRAPQGEVT